jgi:hypothetical protein
MPDAAMALPTPPSFPYNDAVSIQRYPASKAVRTAGSVSASGIRKTPNASRAIPTPLFKRTGGTMRTAITIQG